MSESERVKTGIKALNELTEGGLPRGFSFLSLAGPGTGKTTFGVQYLYKSATKYGESGMYVTFDEPPYSISDNRQRYGWNLGEQEKIGKIFFVDASPINKARRQGQADLSYCFFVLQNVLALSFCPHPHLNLAFLRHLNSPPCLLVSHNPLTLG